MRAISAAVIFGLAAASFAQEGRWAVYAGPSKSVQFLGGEDERVGFVVGVQRSKPDPRVTLRGHVGELVLDAYYLQTKGEEFPGHPGETSHAIGAMVMARYWMGGGRNPWFVDAGFGLQVQNRTSIDLDTYLNTTPTLGVGYVIPTDSCDLQLSLRFIHISNGGTNKPNQGQNQFQFMLGARF